MSEKNSYYRHSRTLILIYDMVWMVHYDTLNKNYPPSKGNNMNKNFLIHQTSRVVKVEKPDKNGSQ